MPAMNVRQRRFDITVHISTLRPVDVILPDDGFFTSVFPTLESQALGALICRWHQRNDLTRWSRFTVGQLLEDDPVVDGWRAYYPQRLSVDRWSPAIERATRGLPPILMVDPSFLRALDCSRWDRRSA